MEECCGSHIGTQIGMLNNLLRRQMACTENHYEEQPLTRMQAMIIHRLSRSDGTADVFQRDIEQEFRLRRSTATGILQLMERHGLVRREPVAHDARLKRLVLTDCARDLNERIRQSVAVNEAVMRRGIGARELEIWFAVSRKICANLEAYQSNTSEGTV